MDSTLMIKELISLVYGILYESISYILMMWASSSLIFTIFIVTNPFNYGSGDRKQNHAQLGSNAIVHGDTPKYLSKYVR